MAARTGKTVWVRDPALAEDQVFIKGKVISESGDQVRSTAAARNKTLLAELCALNTPLSASLSVADHRPDRGRGNARLAKGFDPRLHSL